MKRICIGILAHVDAGKTTLSEALLYHTGVIRKAGRVDHADTYLDTDAIEKKRGITVFAKQAVIRGDDVTVTLLDTPGHADFSAETERALSVLDAAILVVSGTEGVQSHTETLFRLLARQNVPTFLFFNKMDVPSADRETLMLGVKKRLSASCIEAEKLCDPEEPAMLDEKLMETYLNGGNISEEDIVLLIRGRKLFPCFFGSALKMQGIDTLWKEILHYFPFPTEKEEFGARVCKITRDETGKRLTHLKVTGGILSVKETLSGVNAAGETWCEKVDEIRLYSGTKYELIPSAPQGTVCAVTGLTHTKPGDGLGFEKELPHPVLEPVFRYRVLLPEEIDAHAALPKLRLLEEEDPLLRVRYDERADEICLLLMGQVQLEVLRTRIFERFGIRADFDVGSVVYRETIAETVEGVGHYEPLRHYAEVHLLLEPTERGSGLSFAADCAPEMLERSFQRLVLSHLEEKTHVGVLTGSPITDMKITLVAGRAHKKHTEGGDFREATYRAVRQGLRHAESVLLEPWYDYEITLSSELLGRAMSDIQRLGGDMLPPEQSEGVARLIGKAPVVSIQHYGLELSNYSHGKGRIRLSLHGYLPCHNAEEVITERGYDPDADLYNPCDSIFCAGGAGFLVKWDEVQKYMHLESVFARTPEQESEKNELRRRAENYVKAVATDKELQAIFERTYGPIKRREEGKVRVRAQSEKPEPKKRPARPPLPLGDEYLLVDGYNIIFAWDELKKLSQKSLDLARSALIHRLCNYQGFSGVKIILVFDAYKVKKNPGTVEEYGEVSVVYTKEAETADSYIERVSHELSKTNRVRVATSDGSEQMIILGNGALRVPAAAFHKELGDAEKAIREIIAEF